MRGPDPFIDSPARLRPPYITHCTPTPLQVHAAFVALPLGRRSRRRVLTVSKPSGHPGVIILCGILIAHARSQTRVCNAVTPRQRSPLRILTLNLHTAGGTAPMPSQPGGRVSSGTSPRRSTMRLFGASKILPLLVGSPRQGGVLFSSPPAAATHDTVCMSPGDSRVLSRSCRRRQPMPNPLTTCSSRRTAIPSAVIPRCSANAFFHCLCRKAGRHGPAAAHLQEGRDDHRR